MKKGFETPPNIKPLPGCVWRPLEDLYKEAKDIPDDLFISFYSRGNESFGIGVTRKTGTERRQAPYMVWGRWSDRTTYERMKNKTRDLSDYVEEGRLIEPTHSGWMNLDAAFVMVRDFNTRVDKELNDAFI